MEKHAYLKEKCLEIKRKNKSYHIVNNKVLYRIENVQGIDRYMITAKLKYFPMNPTSWKQTATYPTHFNRHST